MEYRVLCPAANAQLSRMEMAVADVRGGSSIRGTALKFGISRTTLSDKVHGITPIHVTMGPSSVLTPAEEKRLITWIKQTGEMGFPVTQHQIISSVSRLVIELRRPNPFKNNTPGKKWFAAFLRRNPEISARTPQNLTVIRANVSELGIRDWFSEVDTYITQHELLSALQDPSRVFNTDETAFPLNPKGKKVFIEKGAQNVYKQVNADEKESSTVLPTVNAAGDVAPPMVVFKYVRVPSEIAKSVPNHWGIGLSETGWMTAETFYEYVTNAFEPWLTKMSLIRPVILFLDGHSSHATLHLSKFCERKQIVLVSLKPNATHLLQPLDVGCFGPLKAHWANAVHEFRVSCLQPIVKRSDFCPLLEKVLTTFQTPALISSSFRKCGLSPWNPNAVDYSRTRKEPNQYVSPAQTVPPIAREDEPASERNEGTLDHLNRLLGPDKVEFFASVATASNWPEILDPEDHNLFTIWRQVYVEAQTPLTIRLPSENNSSLSNSQSSFVLSPSTQALISPSNTNIIPSQSSSTTPLQTGPSSNSLLTPSTEITPMQTGYSSHSPSISIISPSSPSTSNTPLHSGYSANSEERVLSLGDLIDYENVVPSSDSCPAPSTSRCLHENTFTSFNTTPKTMPRTPLKEISSNVAATPTTATPIPPEKNSPIISPFKKVLFYPTPTPQNSTKRQKREKLPTVTTAQDWIRYHEKKIQEKENLEKEKTIRKIQREEKRKKKLEDQAAKVKRPKKRKIEPPPQTDSDFEDNNLSPIAELYNIGDYVIVDYEQEFFPGEILRIEVDKVYVKTMKMAGIDVWKWPPKEDVCYYDFCDVKQVIATPQQFNNRGHYKIPELKSFR